MTDQARLENHRQLYGIAYLNTGALKKLVAAIRYPTKLSPSLNYAVLPVKCVIMQIAHNYA
jgi:hypothetical protein